MTELDRVQTRLENLQSVQPILGAMRTISLASWQTAKKQRATTQHYHHALTQAMAWLSPYLANQPATLKNPHLGSDEKRLVIAIGSERGLCGRFNVEVDEMLRGYLSTRRDVAVVVLGSRLCHLIQQQHPIALTTDTLPKNLSQLMQLAFTLTDQWLTGYEAGAIDGVDIIYNSYASLGSYKATLKQVIPPKLPRQMDASVASCWPPPLIETDPLQLMTSIISQTIALSVYNCLLESAIAEHATRYQRMESATQNATRLANELKIILQTARRQTITQEVQTLAAGVELTRSKNKMPSIHIIDDICH